LVEEVEKHPGSYNFTLSGYSRNEETENSNDATDIITYV